MKSFKKPYVIGIIALAIGLMAGYFFWGISDKKSDEDSTDQQVEASGQIWTCAMHPQIQQPEPGLCPICGMELVPMEESGQSLAANELEMTEAAMKIASIQTTPVMKQVPVKKLYLQGKVKPDERLIAAQTAHFPGRIEELYVNFTGQKISKGQRLASVYSPELVTAQEELLEALKYKETNPALLNAVRNKLKLWKLTEQQIQSIEESGEVRTEIDILSDYFGYVTELKVAVGDHVHEGNVMMTVVDLSRVWVVFDAYESDIAWIDEGDEVEFTIQSLPGRTFEGKVTFIDPVLNPKTRAVEVRTELRNPGELLKPDMFADGRITTGLQEKGETLLVPKSAVLWTGKRAVVYVKDPNKEMPTFEYREVTLGTDAGGLYVIEEGLEEGEEVVANGVFKVDAAAQLQGKLSMMNPEGGKTSTGHDHGGTQMEEGEHAGHEMTEDRAIDKHKIPAAFKQQLADVVYKYLEFKDALVASEPETAKMVVEKLKEALDQVDMSLLKGDAHMAWMEALELLNNDVKRLLGADDLTTQREIFLNLSTHLSHTIQVLGIEMGKDQSLYLEFCPMANNNKGGYWLSTEKEIRNPYFGEKMLKCGEVKETLTE